MNVKNSDNTIEQWDEEFDVVVVGFGGAGACAAIHSDDAQIGQFLNLEAAKALRAAQEAGIPITREEAVAVRVFASGMTIVASWRRARSRSIRSARSATC